MLVRATNLVEPVTLLKRNAMEAWYVVRTHTRAEAKAQKNLINQGYAVYLPLCQRWVTHARRREVVRRPLFPGYLFAQFDIEHTRWRSIISTIGVSYLICQGDVPTRVPDAVIKAIKDGDDNGAFDYTHALTLLQPGAKVRVASGPFANLIGQLQSSVSNDRIRVLLDMLGRHAATELALSDVEPI